MPEISLTEEQREQMEEIRRDVEEAFVDTYGHARLEDAVTYLLDTYTPPGEQGASKSYERIAIAEYPELQAVASDVPDVPGSGIDTEEMRGKLLAELGPDEFAKRLEAASDAEDLSNDGGSAAVGGESGPESAGESASQNESGAQAASEPASPDGAADSVGEANDIESDDESDESATEEATTDAGEESSAVNASGQSSSTTTTTQSTPGGSGGGLLGKANQLLREHDDKWREGAGDMPYEVDLPDGSTETARTKDDVRKLLFQNY